VIHRTTAADWELLREVRLRALADAPRAFASTLELEQDFPESHWRQIAGSDDHHAAFVLAQGGRFNGLVRCFFTYEPGTVFLVNMWVAPGQRRRGRAQDLLESVVGWAQAHGARRVALSLEEVNWPARRLYERNGFGESPTPPRLPYTPGPGDVLVLVRELDA
jgi:ribosomal protein S18 acetylase RimI-like enzyme